jgi:hypothetical protein
MTRKIKEDTYMDTAADCEECDEDVLFFFIIIFLLLSGRLRWFIRWLRWFFKPCLCKYHSSSSNGLLESQEE